METEKIILEGKFFFTLTHKKLEKVENYLKENNILYSLMVWNGYFPKEGAKIVLDYGSEKDTECHFASNHFLTTGKDKVFWNLRKPNDWKIEMPSINDIFKVKKL